MSNVDHPAHYGGGDNPYEVIKVLRQWLSPTEFIGFCKGNSLKYTARANMKGGVEDHEKALWYDRQIISFVYDQRAHGRPDGLPVEPLFWADLYPCPSPDREEIIGCCEHGCVVMLCSTIEPHVQWFVTLGDDQGEDVIEFFPTQAVAEIWLRDRLKEGQRQREGAISDAHAAVRVGDIDLAAEIASKNGLSWSSRAGDNFIMIEGSKVEIGPPNPFWAPADGA